MCLALAVVRKCEQQFSFESMMKNTFSNFICNGVAKFCTSIHETIFHAIDVWLW
jgi:hypothetical protein